MYFSPSTCKNKLKISPRRSDSRYNSLIQPSILSHWEYILPIPPKEIPQPQRGERHPYFFWEDCVILNRAKRSEEFLLTANSYQPIAFSKRFLLSSERQSLNDNLTPYISNRKSKIVIRKSYVLFLMSYILHLTPNFLNITKRSEEFLLTANSYQPIAFSKRFLLRRKDSLTPYILCLISYILQSKNLKE